MSVKDWARIFMSFQAENAHWLPRESTSLPAYGNLILKMKRAGIKWAKYDVIFRQKHTKQIVRRPRKVKNCSVTDIELYLCCDAPREACHKPQPYKRTEALSSAQTASDEPQFKSGTCWKFQTAKRCEGSCLWPNTHNCYSCGGPHSTRICPMSSTTIASATPPIHQGADTKMPFRQLKPKTDKTGSREDRDRCNYKDKDDRMSEEWCHGSSQLAKIPPTPDMAQWK